MNRIPERLRFGIKEQKNFSNYIIVDMGVGGGSSSGYGAPNPFYIQSSELRRKLRLGAIYIGVDRVLPVGTILTDERRSEIIESFVLAAKEEIDTIKNLINGKITFIIANDKLPLPPRSVNEMWIMNVFGSVPWEFDGVNLDRISRVFKPDGKVYIGATYTPELFKLPSDDEFLNARGLQLTKEWTGDDIEMFAKIHGINSFFVSETSIFWELGKI